MADLFHLERSSVKVTVLPLELGSCGIVLGIVFAADGESANKEILELVYASYRVLVKECEVREPPVDDIVSEYIQLDLIRLVLEDMHALLKVARVYAARLLLHLDGNDGRLEVLVLDLPQQLFLAHLIDSQDIAHACYQSAAILTKGERYILAGCGVDELQLGAILYEFVGLNKPEGTGARGELDIDACTQDQVGVCALPATQCGADEVREYDLIISEFFQIQGHESEWVHNTDAGGKLVCGCSWVADLGIIGV